MVRFLLNAGAGTNSETVCGVAPLHHAAQNGYLEIAHLLLDAGADKNSATDHGWPASSLCSCIRSLGSSAAVARCWGGQSNSPTVRFTPLHQVELVRLLLKFGAANAKTDAGETTLQLALAQWLLGHGSLVACIRSTHCFD